MSAGYASAGIPGYWIVNLKQWQLKVFYSPHGNEYTKRVLLEPHDDVIVSSGINAPKTINVGDLIPDSAAGEPRCRMNKDFAVAEFAKGLLILSQPEVLARDSLQHAGKHKLQFLAILPKPFIQRCVSIKQYLRVSD